jgi:signal transduction histidine kinase
VRAEPMAVMRIASNLTANAIKHGETGGVLIGCRLGRDHVALEVHDTGPGMTAGQLSEVMEPYRKGDGSDGHGLGLHLVRTVCLQHNLPFTARSVPQQGSSFRIEIPRA